MYICVELDLHKKYFCLLYNFMDFERKKSSVTKLILKSWEYQDVKLLKSLLGS